MCADDLRRVPDSMASPEAQAVPEPLGHRVSDSPSGLGRTHGRHDSQSACLARPDAPVELDIVTMEL
jgi:hypothetical protein